jgi:hypothetical protein
MRPGADIADMPMIPAYGEILGCRSWRWCQASFVEHSLRPAASVLCKGRKAVIRIRQSSTAGQPNAAGFNKCPPGQYFFCLALFLVRFLQKTALFSVQSIIFAKK